MTRPFFDQDIQLGPVAWFSVRFSILTTLAASSPPCAFAMLHTLRSPSCVWTASMSDFCFEEEACQFKVTIGDGDRDVVSLWRMTNLGCTVAMNSEPFWKLSKG